MVEAPPGRRVVRRDRRRPLERLPGGRRVRAGYQQLRLRAVGGRVAVRRTQPVHAGPQWALQLPRTRLPRRSRHAELPPACPARTARRHGARQHPAQLRARAWARRAQPRGCRGPAPLLREAPKRRDAAILDRRTAGARGAQTCGRVFAMEPGGTLRHELRRGRFYATVRADGGGGSYTLQPVVRDITRAGITFNGRRQEVISSRTGGDSRRDRAAGSPRHDHDRGRAARPARGLAVLPALQSGAPRPAGLRAHASLAARAASGRARCTRAAACRRPARRATRTSARASSF